VSQLNADGSQTTVLHTGAGIGALAVDATFLYFSEGGAVKRMAR
jgi:hypothetical protein